MHAQLNEFIERDIVDYDVIHNVRAVDKDRGTYLLNVVRGIPIIWQRERFWGRYGVDGGDRSLYLVILVHSNT